MKRIEDVVEPIQGAALPVPIRRERVREVSSDGVVSKGVPPLGDLADVLNARRAPLEESVVSARTQQSEPVAG